MSKLGIIGAGHVGTTLAYTAVLRELVDELVLVNRTLSKAEAEAADLRHAAACGARRIAITAAGPDGFDSLTGCDVVAITISVPMPKDLQSRSEMASGNADLLREWVPRIAEVSPDAVLLVITNPVDAMTYLAWRLSGLPARQVIGTGTLIDSARLRSIISGNVGVHVQDLRAYILGEHGDTQFPAFSTANAAGQRLEPSPEVQAAFEQTRRAGYEIVSKKGHTDFAIAAAAGMIVEAICSDSLRTFPVSTLIEPRDGGDYGVEDVCLSIPAVIGRQGVVRTLMPSLDAAEAEQFRQSAAAVRAVIDRVLEPEASR